MRHSFVLASRLRVSRFFAPRLPALLVPASLLLTPLLMVSLLLAAGAARAQPADCPTQPAAGPAIPLSLDLAGRPGVPAGTTGQAYVAIPLDPPGYACESTTRPAADVLHGPAGDVLHGPAGDVLRGQPTPDTLRRRGQPRVRVEQP